MATPPPTTTPPDTLCPDSTYWNSTTPHAVKDPHPLTTPPPTRLWDHPGFRGGSLELNPAILMGLLKEEGEYRVFLGVVVVVAAVALVGNVVVIGVALPRVWSGAAMSPNVLVLFLAISDVLRVFFEMLPKVVEYLCMEWTMGRVLCKLVSSLRCVFSDFSMSTMALISLERYRAVDKPSGAAFTVRRLSLTLLLLWLWTVLCAAPQAFWFDTVALAFGERRAVVCTVPYASLKRLALYTCITRVNFLVPLAASWLCYMGIVHKTVKSRARVSHGLSGVQKSRRQRVSQKVTMTCLCLVTLFTLTLTPFQLTLLVLVCGGAASRQQAARCLKYLWVLTLLESAANPFLYGLLWDNFRKSVKRILHPCKRRSSSVAPLIPHLTGSKRTPFFHPSPRTHPSTSRADATGHQNLSLSTAPGISVSQAPQPDPPLQGALAAPCRSVPPNEQCPGSVCRADGRSEGVPRLPKPDWQPAPSLCDHRWGGNRLWVFTVGKEII